MLLGKSPEYWAREATIDELQDQVRNLVTWTEQVAEVLDFAYVERSMRVLSRTQTVARDEAIALADHLERVAHDSVRAELSKLRRPYHSRWRMLAEIMHRCATRLEVPHKILGRKHVREILLYLYSAGGRVAQGDLTIIPNEGQRSATLKLMEQWDLVERRAEGTARIVSITDLGRLAISEEIASQSAAAAQGARAGQARSASTVERGCTYMYAVS
jgi:hypothetical protein